MSASILLFYSQKCPHCKQFVNEAQQSGLTSLHKVCIDNTPRERIPSNVSSVPALVFAGSNECLQGEKAFQWLNQQIHTKQQNAQRNQQFNPSSNPSQSGGAAGTGGGEPLAYHSTEMGSSFSDTYSFIDNSFTETGMGQPKQPNNGGSGSTIPKNFAFLEQPPQINVMQQPSQSNQMMQMPRQGAPNGSGQMPPTPPLGSFQQSGASDELSKRMEQFKLNRDGDIPGPVRRIS